MASPGRGAQVKGSNFQREIFQYFRDRYWSLTRRSLGETGDDLVFAAFPWMSVELKCQARHDLPGWYAQATTQAAGKVPVLIVKRHGKTDPAAQWVVMELGQFERVLARLNQGTGAR